MTDFQKATTPTAPYAPPVDAPPAAPGYSAQSYSAPGYGTPTYSTPSNGAHPAPGAGTQDERTWAMIAHLGGIVAGFLAPLVVMLTQGEKSPFARRQAVEALNFQILLLIGYTVSAVSMILLIGFLLFPLVWIGGIVFMVIGGIAANKGEDYRYPVNLRLVK